MSTRNQTDKELRERPIGEVAKDLTSDLSLLVRQEIELAKAEMAQKGRTAAPALSGSARPVHSLHFWCSSSRSFCPSGPRR